MLNRMLRLTLAIVLTAVVMVTLARGQPLAHFDPGLDLIDQLTAGQPLGAIYQPSN